MASAFGADAPPADAPEKAVPSLLTVGAGAALPGTQAAVPVVYGVNGAAEQAASLVAVVESGAAWLKFVGITLGPELLAAGKTVDHHQKDGVLKVVLYGGALPLAEGQTFYLLFAVDGAATAGASASVGLSSVDAATPEAEKTLVDTVAGTVTVSGASFRRHSADYDADWRINLSEVLRVVQFYNLGSFSCAAGTEDGFAPGAGDQSCGGHDSDYTPRDWSVSLSELLRIIQFYNAPNRYYGAAPGSEDGFAPGGFFPGPPKAK